MKVLVLSDSHGAAKRLAAVLSQVENMVPQALLYCGDGLGDVLPLRVRFPSFYAVRGNCDLAAPPDIPAEQSFRLNGLEFFLAHGNGYRVKRDVQTLTYRALEAGAKVCCFGHTHRPMAEWVHGVLMLNPGALQDGRYALLTLGEQGHITPALLSL